MKGPFDVISITKLNEFLGQAKFVGVGADKRSISHFRW